MMKVPVVAEWFSQQPFRWIVTGIVICSAVALLVLNQLLAAMLVLVVLALLLEIERRNTRARMLAQQLSAGQMVEKLEVPSGAWGELCRAINGMVQEQRIQERLRATPQLSLDTARTTSNQRTVAVLLVSYTSTQSRHYGSQPSVAMWQELAQATQNMAQTHGALLQPCGDAIMLVFGAWGELPVERALRSAVAAAESLSATWHNVQRAPLAMSVTSGVVAVTSLPGLGFCVLGAPVEQAVQIERLALASPYYRLLCDETAYYALRHHGNNAWRPTEFRIQSADGRPRIVYGAAEAVER